MPMEERPAVAVGHIRLDVHDVSAEMKFFTQHGMREVLNRPDFGILELRGGTHLILNEDKEKSMDGAEAPFDLMVDDIDDAHAKFTNDGVKATDITRGSIHSSFSVEAPSGYSLHITSSHAIGPV